MEQRLMSIINEMLEESELPVVKEYKDSLNLRDDLCMDSLMLAELTVRIEDEFDVDIFEEGLITTLGEVLLRIENK